LNCRFLSKKLFLWEFGNKIVNIQSIGNSAFSQVDIAVTTGRMDYVLGGAALYDTATGAVSTWSLGAGYTSLDYQARFGLETK